ncbi:MAG: hydantoinase/oxoprolinase family protein, partial [Thermomicrobiales bacterium]|nr:hydantoinase/oxoprolinase family protein [Thermomicrobiales bacterium]
TEAEPALSTDAWISHYPIKVPIIDITTIGAGGGSIASITPSGALQVGPKSAGADPGPACYGRGGKLPTVTDANLVLGRLPLELAGGELTLDREAARDAVRGHVAERLGLSIEEAAAGIIRIVDEHMLGALRVVSVQRGLDPRELVLVPFGGAGPVHGGQLATLAGIGTMMVPALPGVLSALGFLLADVKQVFTQTKVGLIGSLDIAAYNAELARLIDDAMGWLNREAVPEADRSVEVALDLRYKGQAYELPVVVAGPLDQHSWEATRERFHAEHKRRYGFDQPFAGVEVVTLRVTAIGSLPKPRFHSLPFVGEDASAALIGVDAVFFDGTWVETPRYDRAKLVHGNRVDGPAIIVQRDCTTVIHPGQTARVDHLSNLIVTTGV